MNKCFEYSMEFFTVFDKKYANALKILVAHR